MKFARNSLALVFLLFCVPAFAQNDGSIPILQKGLADSLNQVFTTLQNVAIKWLGVFMILQFTWTNWQLLLNDADITKVFAKLAGSIFWFCICIYIFYNGSDFLKNVSNGIMKMATGATGVEFDPIQPISTGIDVSSQLLETVNSTQSVLQSLNPFPSIMMGVVAVVILAVSAVLAFKILMVFIETKMVIALSPLSFALLGLNAFRDQGLAPFKYLVSMGIRMFLYGAVLAAMQIFSTAIIAAFKALPAASDPSVWPPIWAAAMGYVLLGAVALRVDSIAVMLASGSSQMSTGDAAAVGAAAGAAAGLAMSAATGGASAAAGAAAKGGQSMADFMKSMGGGGGGAISNAGQQGAGGAAKPGSGDTKQSMASQGGDKSSGAPPAANSAQEGGQGSPNPRAPAPDAVGGAPGAGGVLGLGPTSDAEATAVAKAGAQAPAVTTSPWRDLGDGGGSSGSAGSAPAGSARAGGETSADSASDAPAEAGGGDGFGANLQQEMSQAKAASAALQSTPLKPQASDPTASAAIGGSGSHMDLGKEIARLADQQAKLAEPKKPTLGDRMANASQHTEKAGAVHIQMNTHQSE